MSIALAEIYATLKAFLLLSPILVCAGAAIAATLRFPGFADASRLERSGLALICGFGCVPLLLDLAGRFGPWAMAFAALSLVAIGAPALLRRGRVTPAIHPGWLVAAILWPLIAIALVVDMPGVGNLQHSVLAVDYSKHTATTWALAESGSPPWNPNFYEPGRTISYYYLFYTLPAVATTIGAPLGFAARHVTYATAPLMGFAIFALAQAVLTRSGADVAVGDRQRPANWLLLALLFATGLDFIFLAFLYLGGDLSVDFVFRYFSEWDEQVTSWFNSVMWVPHHLAALCAAFVGFMALAAPGGDARRLLLAVLAFGCMVGESVYVALPAALGAGFWLVSLVWRRRYEEAIRLVIAGLLALALATPWLLTLVQRVGSGEATPIGFRVRGPKWIDAFAGSDQLGAVYRTALLPVFYVVDFGIFALGAYAFWRKAGRRGFANELGVLLLCVTAASFLVGTFLRSTIMFNDLGWRAMLFAQFATLIWTVAAARQGLLFHGPLALPAKFGLGLAYAALVVAVAQMRLFFPNDALRAPLADEISAWTWLDGQLPRGAVVQARPEASRAYGPVLYGRFPMAVADHHNALLFGARKSEIEARANLLDPLFADPALSFEEARRRAAQFDIAALVVSSRDPVFAAPAAWTTTAKADYVNPHFRIYLLNGAHHGANN